MSSWQSMFFSNLSSMSCIRAPGPLITPDFVLCRPTGDIERLDDIDQIVGIEVKKIERTERGAVARATGLDFNTTPPYGMIRVYDRALKPLDIRGFYFVRLRRISTSNHESRDCISVGAR